MSQVGIGVAEIKRCGRWRSSCVNRYIKPSILHGLSNDRKWVSGIFACGLAVGPMKYCAAKPSLCLLLRRILSINTKLCNR